MKQYELTIIARTDLESEADTKVKQTIEQFGGRITKRDDEGVKKLALPVLGQEKGNRFYYEVELPDDVFSRVSKVFNIADSILCYLLAKVN